MFKKLMPIVGWLSLSALVLFAQAVFAQTSTPKVDSVTIINADTGEDIAQYEAGQGQVSVSLLVDSFTNISMRFNTSDTNSVRVSGITSQPRVENAKPFSLLGDTEGVYEPWSPGIGAYTIVVEPFSSFDTSGIQGEAVTVSLSIYENDDSSVPVNPNEGGNSNGDNPLAVIPAIIGLLSSEETVDPSAQQHTVVIVGASIVHIAFGGHDLLQPNAVMMEKLEANGINNIDFYTYGLAGSTIASTLSRIDTVLATFPEAKLIVHIGGNDVSAARGGIDAGPDSAISYQDRSQQQAEKFSSDLDALIAKFDGKEDQLILLPLSYRAYGSLKETDDNGNLIGDYMFLDGSTGTEPYNINEYLPRIPNSQKNVDGNHILDWFNLVRNNRYDYLGDDGVHMQETGNEALVQFTADRLGYLINGTGERPAIIERTQ